MIKSSIFAVSACLLFSGISHSASVSLTWDPELTGADGQYSFFEQNGDASSNACVYFGSSLDLSLSGSEWSYKGNPLSMGDYASIWTDFNTSFANPAGGSHSVAWADGFSMEFSFTATDLDEEVKTSPLFAIIANGSDKSGSTQFSLISFTNPDGGLVLWGDITPVGMEELFLVSQNEGGYSAQIVIGSLDLTNHNVQFAMTAGAIPEPSTATLCLISLAGLMARRKRK